MHEEHQLDDNGFDWRQLWNTVSHRKWAILVLAFVVTLITALVVYSMTPIYSATALVHIQPNQANIVLVDQLVTAVTGLAAADETSLQTAISAVVEEGTLGAPSGARTPDRDLIKGPAGERATDEEIEASSFSVTAQVDGDNWWVVLDMEAADILLEES